MNIFATYECPEKSANFLDNKRMVKMILESAQMLSGALRWHEVDNDNLYKQSHINHPCSIWVRESRANYQWLLNHFIALCNRYSIVYGKIHKCEEKLPLFKQYVKILPDKNQSPFVNCAANKSLNMDFKHIKDTHLAYREYLKARWALDKTTPKFD
jgi:hypothetical protein